MKIPLAGAHDCLIKPVDDNELLLRITALQRRTPVSYTHLRAHET